MKFIHTTKDDNTLLIFLKEDYRIEREYFRRGVEYVLNIQAYLSETDYRLMERVYVPDFVFYNLARSFKVMIDNRTGKKRERIPFVFTTVYKLSSLYKCDALVKYVPISDKQGFQEVYTVDETKLKKEVMTYRRKYFEGFTYVEIEDFISRLHAPFSRAFFDKAMRGNTCKVIDGQPVIYPIDFIKGLICGLEHRPLEEHEWD